MNFPELTDIDDRCVNINTLIYCDLNVLQFRERCSTNDESAFKIKIMCTKKKNADDGST